MMGTFNYDEAFSRNVGWVSKIEQDKLRNSRVVIGGLGGVGGAHAITMARMGVGKFTIADLDTFDWPNLNRQAGAFASTMGRDKLDVIAEKLRDINPNVELHLMPGGVNDENMDEFLQGADLYLDSLDLFAIDIRRKAFRRCQELSIPAVSAAPMGMGASFLAFDPNGMSFEDYFVLNGLTFEDQILKFIIGMSPSMQQRHYLVDKQAFNLRERKAPSTCMGIELATGVACTNGIKLILKRGDVPTAPHGLHFDAYRNKLIKTWRPWGNRNPLQRFMFRLIKLMMQRNLSRK